MRYGSICSGVEAATLAWEPLGWKPAFFAEVEPFPCAVLMQKFGATKPKRGLVPDEADTAKERKQRELWQKKIETFPEGGTIPSLGDFTKIEKEDYDGEIDLLVGGCPCQSYSVAGLRKGLDDPRGNLSLEFARLAYRLETRWFCYENVPGILSQGQGRAFAEILSALCGWEVEVPVLGKKKNGDVVRGWKNSGIVTSAPGGYGLAWRTLDAQFVRVDGHPRAVPQRRRRLFLIGSIGSWERAAAVLFDEESLRGNTPPERKTGQRTARGFEVGPAGGRQSDVSATLDTKCKDGAIRNQTGMLCMAHGQGNAEVLSEKSPTLNCNHEAPVIYNSIRMRGGCPGGGKGPLVGDNISHTLGVGNDQTIICRESGQGFWQEDKASGTVKVNGAEPTTVVCYDARGNGSGDVSPNLTGGHADRVNDYMPVILEGKSYGIAENIINRKVKNGGNGVGVQEELQYTLNTSAPHGVCCFVKNDAARDYSEDVAMTLRSQAEHAVSYRSTVRRLMPVECERLMGFPDGHTQIEWNGKPASECPDTPRYKACGNAFCVNVAKWVGMRIQQVEDFYNERT
ncbi:MAG: DNA cytosine methyltransferase [Victivallaceae bacterium]|nr:DNA cytosine methyltransferase [Victivallaceae bacterium]